MVSGNVAIRIVGLVALLALVSCRAESRESTETPEVGMREGVPAGFRLTPLVDALRGPTQMLFGPDGRLWLAQLAGGENDGSGEVWAIDLADGSRERLLGDLRKPTGIAVLDGALWIAAERDLLRAPLLAAGGVGAPETVLANLPYNGRSNGTLTVSPAGLLIYETSGSRQGNRARPGSGTLWQLDPAQPDAPVALATGLKGAYAHTFDALGRLWITEIGDDDVNGEEPPDELNLVVAGADFGWPVCYGDRLPARNYGGTEEMCAATRSPVATFPAQATPTSVIVAPWNPQQLLVALWNSGEVVAVDIAIAGDNAVGTVSPFLTLQRPQHLLATPDGAILISDFREGIVYRLEQVE